MLEIIYALLGFFAAGLRLLANERGSLSMPNGWVHQFSPMLLETMQQQNPIVVPELDNAVKRSGVKAAIDTWERVGNILLQPLARHGQTQALNPNHTRRGITIQTIGGAILVSKTIDIVRMLLEPSSQYRDLLAAAAVQARDKAILDAAIGTATTLSVSATTGQISYGSQAMKTSYQIGDNTAMSLTRIIAAVVLLSKASVPQGAKNRVFFYSPGQLTDLLAITQASSSDFTNNRIHDNGFDGISWEGFKWVEIQDVVDETVTTLVNMLQLPASDTRYCIAMGRKGVGYSSAQEPEVEINVRADLNNDRQVFISESYGAGRLFEGTVVQVSAKEN